MKIAFIIPAAGLSRRQSLNKLIDNIDGKPVIQKTIETYLANKGDIFLITGHESEKVIQSLDRELLHQITVLHNPHYHTGLSSSVKIGIHHAKATCDYYGFGLGDKPFIQPETVDYLCGKIKKEKPLILIPTYKDNVGHPTFFSISLYEEFGKIHGDSGGREIIKAHQGEVYYCSVNDPGIILDMDLYYSRDSHEY